MNANTAQAAEATVAVPKRNNVFDVDFDLNQALSDRQYIDLIPLFFICGFALWHLATNIWLVEPGIWQNCIHFAGFALLAAIMTSAHRISASAKGTASTPANDRSRFNLYGNIIFGVAIAASSLWLAHAENGLYARTLAKTGQPWQFGWLDWIAAAFVIVGALELTRRLTGWIIPTLVVLSMSYILFLGEQLPGAFRAASLPLDDVIFRSLYNDEGMFGIITTISSSNITLFMIFGAFLVVSGASDFVIELAKVVASRFRGGAAFVAVISSALTGTSSGSAIANTASTGVITIPLMKSNGFRPQFAAGIEAAASTGGQLMPPIMGAGAFIMASYTGIA